MLRAASTVRCRPAGHIAFIVHLGRYRANGIPATRNSGRHKRRSCGGLLDMLDVRNSSLGVLCFFVWLRRFLGSSSMCDVNNSHVFGIFFLLLAVEYSTNLLYGRGEI